MEPTPTTASPASEFSSRLMYVTIYVLTGLFILTLFRLIYFTHPFYVGFLSTAAHELLSNLYSLLVVILLLDALRKLLSKSELPKAKTVQLFVLAMLIASYVQKRFRGEAVKLNLTLQDKGVILSFAVKFFYVPVMANFLTGNWEALLNNVHALSGGAAVNFDSVYALILAALFMVDVSIFTFAYVFEAEWLHNRIRSVEPTMLGWVVALAAYPPFNSVTSQFFTMQQGGLTLLAQNTFLFRLVQIVILICYVIFVAASVSLGTRGSNLTNRGIVARGPYAVVRHPAYVSKLCAWFCEGLLYATNPAYFLGWIGFATIYILRAITEERHLGYDPDYVAYKQKVKWRFVPGVV